MNFAPIPIASSHFTWVSNQYYRIWITFLVLYVSCSLIILITYYLHFNNANCLK